MTTFLTRLGRGGAWRAERAFAASSRQTRRATSSLRSRPTFLLLGAQKAGTTSLHQHLRDHPAVLTATVKEVQYFNKEYHRGDRWYLSHFPLRTHTTAVRGRRATAQVGEATAAYLFDPRVPLRVHAFDSGMRLVAVLRDPVERAYSHHQMEIRWRRELLPFPEALRREEVELPLELERIAVDPLRPSGLGCAYVARGRYAEQLERWLALFPREQLLVLFAEELVTDPRGQLTLLADFLELPPFGEDPLPHRGAQRYDPRDPPGRERLAELFEPENRRLAALLGRTLPWPSSERTAAAARSFA